MSTTNDDQSPADAAVPEAPTVAIQQQQQHGDDSHMPEGASTGVTGGVSAPPPPPPPFIKRMTSRRPAPPPPPPPRGLSVDNGSLISMRIPNDYQALAHTKETHGEESLEHKVLKFLHSKTVQVILACLLFLDVLIIFAELTLWSIYPHCSIIIRDGISCCSATSLTTEDTAHTTDTTAEAEEHQERGRFLLLMERYLSGDTDTDDESHEEDFCASGLEPQYQYEIGCDEHKWYRVHTAELVLFGITMTILSIFMLELIILMICIRPNIFFRHFFYVLDFIVVSGSIILESLFHTLGNDLATTFAGFLIVIRLWRFVRIGHGITEIISEVSNEKYQELLAYTEELESILQEHHIKLPTGSIRPIRISGHNDLNTPDVLEALEEHKRMKMRKTLKRVDEKEDEDNEK